MVGLRGADGMTVGRERGDRERGGRKNGREEGIREGLREKENEEEGKEEQGKM